MPLDVYKPIADKDFLSYLVPTRGRADAVRILLDSFEATVARPDKFDVWAYVDEDDMPTLEVLQGAAGRYPFAVHWVCGPATDTQGEMYNVLRERSTTNPGLYMIGSDKTVFNAPGWDEVARKTVDRYPDRLVFTFPKDQVNGGRFGAFFILTAEWANVLGRLMTEYFPFWFDDTWLNEVAKMLGRHVALETTVEVRLGWTQRMQNLLFWERFFNCTVHDRIEEATKLRRAIYDEDEAAYQRSLAASMPEIEEALRVATPNKQRDAQLFILERDYGASLKKPEPRLPRGTSYRRMEDQACAYLARLIMRAGNRGQFDHVSIYVNALLHASNAAEDQIDRVRGALEQNDLATAGEGLETLITRFANFPETYELMVDKWLREGNVQEAFEMLEMITPVFPEHIGLKKRFGVVLFSTGDLPRAEAVFHEVARHLPNDPDVVISLAHLALNAARFDEAFARFQAAAAMAPDDVDAWIGQAIAARPLQKDQERQVAIAHVQALAPTHPVLPSLVAP